MSRIRNRAPAIESEQNNSVAGGLGGGKEQTDDQSRHGRDHPEAELEGILRVLGQMMLGQTLA